jgi:Delta7-sterol 5-desaturase
MIKALQAFFSSLEILDWSIIAVLVMGLATAWISGYFKARRIQKKGTKWIIVRHEVMWATINLLVSAFTLGALKTYLTGHGYILFNPEPAPWRVIGAEFSIYFFLFDTWFYWGHRLMHMEPIYTWTHKTHHFSTTVTPLSSLSVNPVEAFINGSFTPLFYLVVTLLAGGLIGISPIHGATIPLITFSTILMGFYVHSGFEFLPRWWNKSWLTKWFISATFHDQHHQYFIGNFGGYTTIWDRICGTMRKNFEADFEKITSRPLERRSIAHKDKATAAEG